METPQLLDKVPCAARPFYLRGGRLRKPMSPRQGARACRPQLGEGRSSRIGLPRGMAAGLDQPTDAGSNSGVGCLGEMQESGVGCAIRWTRHPRRKVSLASSRPDIDEKISPSAKTSKGFLIVGDWNCTIKDDVQAEVFVNSAFRGIVGCWPCASMALR